MDALITAGALLFEGFRLYRNGLARRDQSGAFVPVPIGSRALEILRVLVERPGELVTRDEIMNAVWPGVVVEDSNLSVHVAVLRRVLDNRRTDGSCIQTVPGRGYRFVAKVTRCVVEAGGVPLLPRLSIVVLPFANLSNDPGQQYFVDGLTDDVTTDLSRLAHMAVISRNTAFTYRNSPLDTKQIARELGVRYVLEGSVRRAGGQVRVNAQLIDAETDTHLWADRFDRDAGDLLAVQDEITSRSAIALNLEMVAAEAARQAEHPDALDWILRGRAALSMPASAENYAEAVKHFERALTLDPRSADAQSLWATTLVNRILDFRSCAAHGDLGRAEQLAARAVAASHRSPLAHLAKGQALRVRGCYAEAIHEYETVLSLNHNSVAALAYIGRCKIFLGLLEEAIQTQEESIRRSPRDPSIWVWFFRIGQASLLQSRIDQAVAWLEKARSANPAPPFLNLYLASAYALRGDTERGTAELLEARRLSSCDLYASIAHVKALADYGLPPVRALFETTYFAGLRKAGMPEE